MTDTAGEETFTNEQWCCCICNQSQGGLSHQPKIQSKCATASTACAAGLDLSHCAQIMADCWYYTEMLPITCQPLADGASNPSLCERSKLPALPNEDSSSLTDGESLSQEQDNDDSSQFVSSSLVPKCLQNQSFTRVSDYPQTLTQPR